MAELKGFARVGTPGGSLDMGVGGFFAGPVVPSVMAIRIGLRVRRELTGQREAAHRRLAAAAIVLGFAELVAAVVVVVLLVRVPRLVASG